MMGVIFLASTSLFSWSNTSQFLAPLLRWFLPDISPRTVEQLQFILRKAGHLTEYALLAFLLYRALAGTLWNDAKRWFWIPAWMTLGIAGLFAISDEFHQSLVATRTASPRDVLIDCCGAAFALLLLWSLQGRRLKAQAA